MAGIANVLTALQFERVLAPTGPFSGHICRPIDGKMPHKVAFIQCVGSRDVSREANLNYCSAVCCMYATKQAILLKEEHPETDVAIFYIDMRTFGKGYEGFYDRAKKMGIRYIRFKPSYLEEIPGNRDLRIRYINESGETVNEEFNLVILSCGMGPAEENKILAEKFGFELNEFGFCKTDMFAPVETTREGIYSLGVFNGPKDISESVTQGSAAVVKALSLLADAKGTLIKDKVYPPEKDVAGQDARIGVFICHCGKNIASVVDVPAVVEYAKKLPNVVYAENFLYACSADSGEKMKHIINEYALNRMIVASCTPRTHEPLFQENMKEAGLNPHLFEMANIRDQCAWVHTNEPEMATKKAKDIIKMAVSKSKLREPLYSKVIDVNHNCLIIGGGLAGMTAALDLANQGFETYLLEQSDALGGNLRRLKFLLDGQDPQQKLQDMIQKVQSHPKIKVFMKSEILKSEGSVADFKTEFRSNGETHTLAHGAVIIATGAEEYKPHGVSVRPERECHDPARAGGQAGQRRVHCQYRGDDPVCRLPGRGPALLQPGVLLPGSEERPEDQGAEARNQRVHPVPRPADLRLQRAALLQGQGEGREVHPVRRGQEAHGHRRWQPGSHVLRSAAAGGPHHQH